MTFTSENYSALIDIDFSLLPDQLAEVYPHLHTVTDNRGAQNMRITEIQTFQTLGSKDYISLASRIMVNGRELLSPHVSTQIAPGETLVIERFVSVFWAKADLAFPHASGPTDALRFNLYHLQSSAAFSPQTSVPAKALTGRAYEGHIFWDTEVFIFPFFLYTQPEIARQLLLYRYNTLPGARLRASNMGFRGACYAWESTVTGKDVTPRFVSISGAPSGNDEARIPIFTGTQELHITADNAFTNWMVRHNLEISIKMVNWLSKEYPCRFSELSSELNFIPDEFSKWHDVLKQLYIPQPGVDSVIEQFEGFFSLKPIKLSPSEKTRAPISRLFDWDTINHTRIVKQADVLMIPFLFPDRLSTSEIRANYEYYDSITDQGSSLSPCIHAAIAARIGRMDDALKYWRESLYFDLHNTMSNSQLGIHAAALGGTWQALVFHLLGVRLTESGCSFDHKAISQIKSVLHPTVGDWSSEWLNETIKRYSCDLILIPSGHITEENSYGIQIRRNILEQSTVPALILSSKIELMKTPIGSTNAPKSEPFMKPREIHRPKSSTLPRRPLPAPWLSSGMAHLSKEKPKSSKMFFFKPIFLYF